MGPLEGLRVVEIASVGPGPFAAMVLADLGAEVIRIDRPGGSSDLPMFPGLDLLNRGRRSAAIDLKHPDGVTTVLRLVEQADVLIEGFRPGVAERLGIGPEVCHTRNPGLVYGRMTGWGQDGPAADTAGHDIDFIAVAGALEPLGDPDRPPPSPINFIGDFGGGAMLLAFGIMAALWEKERSGKGQVVDAAMVDGAALITTMLHSHRAMGLWQDARGANLLDGAAPFYRTYQTADGRYVAVGALEPKFYAALLAGLGLADDDLPPQYDRDQWPELERRFDEAFRQRTRDEWAESFAGTDACVAPVLAPHEASGHPHLAARGTFIEVDGVLQPAPAPRFDRTPGGVSAPPPLPGAHTTGVLADWGFGPEDIEALRSGGAIA